MKTPIHRSRIRKENAQGRIASSLKLNIPDPLIVELAGLAGASAVWLCNEHVPSDWRTMENCIRAAKLHGMDAIIRVSKGSYSEYLKPFEADAAGIMVPHVTSADEARSIVDMCRAMPLGRRAMDAGNIDGAFCQLPLAEYIDYVNHEKLIILQIESPEGLEAVEEIAAVPGYDMLLLGPGDFSHRIGKPGQIDLPEVHAARERVENAARANGKKCFSVLARGTAEELFQRGYAVTHVEADVLLLGRGFREAIAGLYGGKTEEILSTYSEKSHAK
jgi:4-hydroxy-2-oxoheptanedioate aldolase